MSHGRYLGLEQGVEGLSHGAESFLFSLLIYVVCFDKVIMMLTERRTMT